MISIRWAFLAGCRRARIARRAATCCESRPTSAVIPSICAISVGDVVVLVGAAVVVEPPYMDVVVVGLLVVVVGAAVVVVGAAVVVVGAAVVVVVGEQ